MWDGTKQVISGYVQDGDGEKARNMFVQMREIGLQPSKITYLTMLSSCTNQGWGKLLHALLLRNELKLEVFLGTALLAMYVKYGNIVDAWQVFDRIPEKNDVSWTVMISSYTEYGNRSQALKLFEEMQYYFTPNRVTYINMLNACGSAVEFVKILHSHLLKFNIQLDMFIENKLLDIYIKCGNSEVAQQIFDRLQERDVVAWTSMVSGYAENQNGFGALKLFLELLHSGLEPNQATFVSVLCGCSSATALEWGRFIHAYVIQAGLNSEIFLSNSNIAMYIACGSIDDAWQVFKLMPSPDVVSCTAMLSGLVQFGDASNAIKLYHQMQHYDLELNKVTYLSAISACSSLGGLECARHVHNDVIKLGLDSDIILGNSLIGMYAKCGCIDDARHVFDKMSAKDDVTWISLISGYAQNGCGNDVMKLFKEMLSNGFKPDNLVLVSLLVACGHIGLLDVGYNCFVAMGHLYEIKLTADHYACMVDHLGHAGSLTEAKDLIDAMPFEPDVPVWLAFVTACRVHRDLKLANIIVGNVDG